MRTHVFCSSILVLLLVSACSSHGDASEDYVPAAPTVEMTNATDPMMNTTTAATGDEIASQNNATESEEWRRVGVDTFAKAMETNPNATILDVRTEAEWKDSGHIKGATLLPHDSITSDADLPKDKAGLILLYCGSGKRSAVAAQTLLDLGYTNLEELETGIKGWKAAGKSVEY
mmetsp:Transcript_5360/g.9641  ORF Transcript_5360/g.9641 Transcript_5360/m.9641 type:complete len:174 (-) Transcript_5360:99-620(-)|eukprot:CAMPEP_0197475860 /NCGR_PEP_ID=MMETSP1309-20131121/7246_1 /TAXON_ID=464262 /ORGANISM="Genus nov. species nov., Strain RCC998" /LENGTH=173 /DNA_ID=CAMNT_0043015985 /DNA_START=149 /DNA_END=670 /DNA_ORIENTATION=-